MITGAVIGIIIASIILSAIFYLSQREDKKSYQNLIRTEQQKAKTWQDASGHWRQRAEAAEIKSADALKNMSRYDDRFSSIQKDFDIVKKNLKNLQYAGFTGTQSKYEVHTSSRDTLYVVAGDSTKARYFEYEDSLGWFRAEGMMLSNGVVPMLRFQSRDSLVTVMTVKKRLFRRPLYQQEVKSMNPHTRVAYSQSVIVRRRK